MSAGKRTAQGCASDISGPRFHREWGQRSTTRYKALWIGYWLFLFVIMHVPVSRTGPLTIEHADKVVHFSAYFLLAWLGSRQLARTVRPQLILTLVVWAAIYVTYGAVDEWLQSFVGRTMSLADWLADLAGVVTATVLAGFLGRRQP